jgi:hypothetical protein
MTNDKHNKRAARELAAREGISYTAARRRLLKDQAPATEDGQPSGEVVSGPPDDGFGGHEFEYESDSDLFRCVFCRVYGVTARRDGAIAPCRGLVGYGGDPERVYLMLTIDPETAQTYMAWLANRISEPGIGRTPRYGYRPGGRWLVESAPSVVDELARHVAEITVTTRGGEQLQPFQSIEHLTAEEGRQVLAANYTAYVERWGEPAALGTVEVHVEP